MKPFYIEKKWKTEIEFIKSEDVVLECPEGTRVEDTFGAIKTPVKKNVHKNI